MSLELILFSEGVSADAGFLAKGALSSIGEELSCVSGVGFFLVLCRAQVSAAGAMEEAVKKVEAGKVDGRRERRLEEWLFCS